MRKEAICLLLLLTTASGCTVAEGRKRLSLPLMGGEQAQPAPAVETVDTAVARGRAMEANEHWDQARTHYRELIAAYPNRHEPYHRLGVVADHQGYYREAQDLYSEALRRSPNNAQVFSDLGYSFYLEGELNKAESAMLKAVQLEPSNPCYLNNLGLVLGQMGQREAALAHFRQAGSEADAQYNLAFVYASQDRPDLAIVCFEKALEADPEYQAARDAIESFRASAYEAPPTNAREAREGYVPYLESGGETTAAESSTLAPRNQRLIRGVRMEGYAESSL